MGQPSTAERSRAQRGCASAERSERAERSEASEYISEIR